MEREDLPEEPVLTRREMLRASLVAAAWSAPVITAAHAAPAAAAVSPAPQGGAARGAGPAGGAAGDGGGGRFAAQSEGTLPRTGAGLAWLGAAAAVALASGSGALKRARTVQARRAADAAADGEAPGQADPDAGNNDEWPDAGDPAPPAKA